jgi:hypothetical protein
MNANILRAIPAFVVAAVVLAGCGGVAMVKSDDSADAGLTGLPVVPPAVTVPIPTAPAPSVTPVLPPAVVPAPTAPVPSVTPVSPPTVPTRTALLCSQPQGPQVSTPTETSVSERLVRRWVLCGAQSFFGTSDESGLEFASDGRWYKLFCDSAGQLVRGQGAVVGGNWSLTDTSVMNGPGYFQLNIDIDGSGRVITFPALSDDPVKMRLNNNGVYTGDYVPAGTDGACAKRQ